MSNSFSLAAMRVFAMMLCVTVFCGCSKSGSDSAESAKKLKPLPLDWSTEEPLAEADKLKLEAFGQELAAAVSEGDDATFKKLFVHKECARRFMRGVSASKKFKKGFLEGVLEAFDKRPGGLAWGFFGQNYTFLRIHPTHGQHRVLCRIQPEVGGVSYHAYTCIPTPEGIRAVDFYDYASGELVTRTMRNVAIMGAAEERRSQSFVGRLLSDEEAALGDNAQAIKAFGAASQSGDIDKAIEIYDAFPKKLQDLKPYQIAYLSLLGTREEDEPRYIKASEKYAKDFPGDPSLVLMMIDYHLLKKDFVKASESVKQLDQQVGGDVYLQVIQGSILYEEKKFAEALALCEDAILKEPSLEDAYWNAIVAASGLNDFASMTKHMTTLRDNMDYLFEAEELAENEVYQAFTESPEGKAFMALE